MRSCAPASAGLDRRARMVAEGVVRSDSAEIMKAVVGEMRFPRAKQGTHPSKVASQNSEALATAGNIIDEVRDAFHGASIEGWNPRAVHGLSSMLA
jgi:hypothetical protein